MPANPTRLDIGVSIVRRCVRIPDPDPDCMNLLTVVPDVEGFATWHSSSSPVSVIGCDIST